MSVALADPRCDVLAGRVVFRVDPQAESCDVVPGLAALLIGLARERRRQRREHGSECCEPTVAVMEGHADAV